MTDFSYTTTSTTSRLDPQPSTSGESALLPDELVEQQEPSTCEANREQSASNMSSKSQALREPPVPVPARTRPEGTKEVRSFLRERAPSARTKVSGKDKASVIASIAAALKDGNFPSMDERLKGIVASQVGDLLRGGFRLDEIRYAAVELGLSWDQKRGHNRLCHLAARVRSEFWSEQQADHADVILAERSETMDIAGKPHPNAHPYASDGRGSCIVCTGPIGVHVRRAVVV